MYARFVKNVLPSTEHDGPDHITDSHKTTNVYHDEQEVCRSYNSNESFSIRRSEEQRRFPFTKYFNRVGKVRMSVLAHSGFVIENHCFRDSVYSAN